MRSYLKLLDNLTDLTRICLLTYFLELALLTCGIITALCSDMNRQHMINTIL